MSSLFRYSIRPVSHHSLPMAGTIQTLSILGYLILFISEVGGAELPAENSSATDANQQIRFHNITVQDGLSHYRVRVMTQDKFGFIWMGSGNSLERFDGKNITTYKNNASDPNSLPYAEVSFLLDDPERDIIWIGTRSGLWYIDIITFRITRVNLGPYNDIRTIAMDQEEGLWIGAQTGLLHFSPLTTDYEVYNTIVQPNVFGDLSMLHGAGAENFFESFRKWFITKNKEQVDNRTWSEYLLFATDYPFFGDIHAENLIKCIINKQFFDRRRGIHADSCDYRCPMG